jgi:hypothetical protein
MSSLAAAREASHLLRIVPVPPPKEISLSIDQNIFQHNGKWYVIYKNCDNMNNEVINKISPLFELNKPDNVLQPGVYTWMITTDERNTPHLYVKKTLFLQEIQTKHSNIVYDLRNNTKEGNEGNIYYAGELKISDHRELNFNFLSGSYMLGRALTEPNEDAVLKFFTSKFPRYEVTYDKITPGEEKTYITADEFVMDEERFELLKRVCPGNIYEFDNQKDAKTFARFEFDNAIFGEEIKQKEKSLSGSLKPKEGSDLEKKIKARIAELKGKIKTLANYESNKLRGGGKNKKKYSTRKKQKRLRKKTTRQKK